MSRCPETIANVLETREGQFFSKWDLSYKWVFWGCGFQGIQCSPNHLILAEVYVLTHEPLPRNNGKCSRNNRRSVFLKMGFIMQVNFLRLWSSRYPVFSESHDSNRSLCFNTWAAAQKQLQMFQKQGKVSFSQNEIYHTSGCSEVVVFKVFSVLRITWFLQKSMC